MADKSFGVKELNLLNASGTPTITSPNNLNLNANTVAISTSVTIGHNLTVSANAGIASLNVTGVSTFVGLTTFRSDIHIVGNQAIDINNNALLLRGNNGGNGFITNTIGHLYISSLNDVENLCTNNFSVKTNTSEQAILATKNGSVAIYHDGGNKKLETTTNGIDVTGAITVNGSATSAWTISNNGSSNYVISGLGGLSSANNPDLYLERGQTYQFIMNAAGHGFGIQTSSGTWNSSNAYTTGITNAGAATGVITFQVPYSAPERLYYACTSGHSGMVGNIYIHGAGGNNTNVGVTTFSGFVNVNGNFGLETSSPVAQTDSSGTALTPVLDLKGTGSIANESGVLQLTRKDNATQGSCIYNSGDDAGLTMRNTDGNGMGFYNGTILALRVDSNGRFTALGNKPSSNAQMLQNTSSTNPEGLYIRFPNASPNSSSRHALKFSDSAGDKAVIDSNGNSRNLNNSYGGFSDISLKENIVDAGSQWDDIKNIKVRVFNFKVDSASDKRIGVVAQEIETVCPKLVGISYDKDVNGNLLKTGVKSVKYSVLYMKAIKALQEAQARIETLETKVAALESS